MTNTEEPRTIKMPEDILAAWNAKNAEQKRIQQYCTIPPLYRVWRLFLFTLVQDPEMLRSGNALSSDEFHRRKNRFLYLWAGLYATTCIAAYLLLLGQRFRALVQGHAFLWLIACFYIAVVLKLFRTRGLREQLLEDVERAQRDGLLLEQVLLAEIDRVEESVFGAAGSDSPVERLKAIVQAQRGHEGDAEDAPFRDSNIELTANAILADAAELSKKIAQARLYIGVYAPSIRLYEQQWRAALSISTEADLASPDIVERVPILRNLAKQRAVIEPLFGALRTKQSDAARIKALAESITQRVRIETTTDDAPEVAPAAYEPAEGVAKTARREGA